MVIHDGSMDTEKVRDELYMYHLFDELDTIRSTNSFGKLRLTDGRRSRTELLLPYSNARTRLLFESGIFQDAVDEFIDQSGHILGSDNFETVGYVGRVQQGGVLAFLHRDSGIARRLTQAFAMSGDQQNTSTVVYTGCQEDVSPMNELSIDRVARELGNKYFVQAEHGQIVEFSGNEYHVEPTLHAGTPRLLLVSTVLAS